jgi:protein-L-isoaspartate(D-aspartate) O-methyltransferase
MTTGAEAVRDRFLRAIEEAARDAPGIVNAFRGVDRGEFVPDYFLPDPNPPRTWPIEWKKFSRADGESWAEHVYSPHAALVTKFGSDGMPTSSSTDPLVMIAMLKALRPAPGDRILEIGAGTGYNAAILSHLVGAEGRVVSIDIDDDLCATARTRLQGYPNVDVTRADGRIGFPAAAPYEGILVTANAVRLEEAWISQVTPDGCIVVNLNGPMTSGMFAGRRSRNGSIAGCFLDIPQVGFIPLLGHRLPVRFDDAAIAAEREAETADVPAKFAVALLGNDDALAFIQLAVPARRSTYVIEGCGERRAIAGFRRGNEQCWIHPVEPPAPAARAYYTGSDDLLSDLLDAHARWVAIGSPRKSSLRLAIGEERTQVSVNGTLAFVTRLFSPMTEAVP